MENLSVNLIERYVLECLGNTSKSLDEITFMSKINKNIVGNTLTSLLTKNIILKTGTKFQINNELTPSQIKELQSKENKYFEISEIITSCLRTQTNKVLNEDSIFKFKKVLLTSKEEKILNGLLYNLEAFIDSIPKKQTNIADQKILFWGGGRYETITSNVLNY